MEIKITNDLNLRDKKSIIQPLIDKKQLLVILEIGEDDTWQSYPELIGKTGKFIKSEDPIYPNVFQTESPIEINIFDSKTLQDKFLFSDVTLGIVHTDMNSLTEEISIHSGTDHENASDNLIIK